MAYMNQERKAQIAPKVKEILKKYDMKGSLSVDNHSTLVLNIKSGPIDFWADMQYNAFSGNLSNLWDGGYIYVNTYWVDMHYSGVSYEFLREVIDAMNVGNHDNSDIMSDYFDVGWYVNVNVGKWNKPYVNTNKVVDLAA